MNLILLIEDDKTIRENTQELLVANGYRCITAADGKEGLELAISSQPDIILCDIILPILDGYAVKIELDKMPNMTGIPFIFLTAKSSRDDLRSGMDLGAADFITKPFKIEELLTSIKKRFSQIEDQRNIIKIKVVDAVTDFVKIAEHECNTPLNAIINFSELLTEPGLDDFAAIAEMGVCINMSGKRLHKTLSNLIALVGLQHYKLRMDKYFNVDVAACLQSIALRLSSQYNRAADLVINIDEIHSSTILNNDLTILFTELVDNAFKFSEPGDNVNIALQYESQNNMVYFVITNVIEAPVDFDLHDIGPFKQFNREKNEQQGSGLGLYLSKLICSNYGGGLQMGTGHRRLQVLASLPIWLLN